MIHITIGRNKDNRYIIHDPANRVSGNHAEIMVHNDNSITLMDTSTNGTTLNGKKIERNVEVQIKRTDKIVFASTHTLDWGKIPSLPPIEPGTKLYSIGKHLTNRININDPAGTISRYHATLKINPKGKMFLLDHSSNGTYINGTRIPANQDVMVKRRDKILFANTKALDWKLIQENQPLKFIYFIPVALVLILGIILIGNKKDWFSFAKKTEPVASFSMDKTKAETGEIIAFTNTSQNASLYSWNFGDGDTSTYASPKHAYSKDGTFTVTCSAKGDGGENSTSKTIAISPKKSKPTTPKRVPKTKNKPEVKPKTTSTLSSQDIYKKYQNAVVCIYHSYQFIAEMANGKKYVLGVEDGELVAAPYGSGDYIHGCTGTAFFVDPRGTMLTNRHVTIPWERDVEKYKRYSHFNNIKIYKIYGETVYVGFAMNDMYINRYSDFVECTVSSSVTESMQLDVGILRTKAPQLPKTNIEVIDIEKALLNQNELAISQKVYCIGYPLGLDLFDSAGTTNAVKVGVTCQSGELNKAPDGVLFGVNVQMTHGASGSPVLNEKGQLIGVFNSGFDNTQGLNYAVLAKHAKELYDRAK